MLAKPTRWGWRDLGATIWSTPPEPGRSRSSAERTRPQRSPTEVIGSMHRSLLTNLRAATGLGWDQIESILADDMSTPQQPRECRGSQIALAVRSGGRPDSVRPTTQGRTTRRLPRPGDARPRRKCALVDEALGAHPLLCHRAGLLPIDTDLFVQGQECLGGEVVADRLEQRLRRVAGRNCPSPLPSNRT